MWVYKMRIAQVGMWPTMQGPPSRDGAWLICKGGPGRYGRVLAVPVGRVNTPPLGANGMGGRWLRWLSPRCPGFATWGHRPVFFGRWYLR